MSTSEEIGLFGESARRFVDTHYSFAARPQRIAASQGYDRDIWSTWARLGWLGIALPEDFGGSAAGPHGIHALMQELGRGLVAEPYVAYAVLGAGIVLHAGTAEQKARLLPELAAGRLALSFGFAEPGSRYDLANVQATARQAGSAWVLDGRKSVVLGAADADLIIVSARLAGPRCDPQGIGLFALSPGQRGLSIRPYRNVDGQAAADIALEDVEIAPDKVIGVPGAAHDAMLATLDDAAFAVCAEAVGCMQRAVELTVEHVKGRRQFGKPLAEFQALQHRIVDMYIALEESRSIVTWAAACLAGEDGSAARHAARAAVSAAKAYIALAAPRVGEGAVQMHGAMGIIDEVPIGHYLKRLTAIDRSFGDRAFHLDRYAALEL